MTGSGRPPDNLAPGMRGEACTLWHFSRPQARQHAAMAMPCLRVARCRCRVTAGHHRPAGSGGQSPGVGRRARQRPSSGELVRVYVGRYVRIPLISVDAYIQAHTVEASSRSGLVALVLMLAVISGRCTMPNDKGRRRRFGSVRRLPSGPYQARYLGPDGVVRPADDTFATKTEAEVWLTRKEAEILEEDWIDPAAGEILLSDYGATWIEERPGLRPKTVTLYRYLLRSHIAPYFPAMTIARLTSGHCPALAQETARQRRQPGHCCQGLPAAARHHEHRRR